ncbi:MAG: hypothetical protein BM564_00765 [Bacteroidetes bacterium MedPE-SWsnd-G2]|nr:MAG: hypothetical protein BM564_00765 [Bacteroidetes bacterium MedPE-SWsnd-G2]
MKRNDFKVLLGVPVLILILVLMSVNYDTQNSETVANFNPYYKALPQDYLDVLNKSKSNDTTFFSAVLEKGAIRKLLVFKAFPNDIEFRTDFGVQLVPKDKSLLQSKVETLNFEINDNAMFFNANGKTYGVFKLSLPLIETDKILISKKTRYKKEKKWEDTLTNPFKPLDASKLDFNSNGLKISKEPVHFTSLLLQLLAENEISFLRSQLMESDKGIFRFYQSPAEFARTNELELVKVTNSYLFWKKLEDKDQTALNLIQDVGDDNSEIRRILEDYLVNDLPFNSLFMVEKLAYYEALIQVFSEDCDETYLMFNTQENALEPFHAFSNCKGEKRLQVFGPTRIKNQNYLNQFASAVDDVTRIDLYTDLIEGNHRFKNEVIALSNQDPFHVFNFDVLRANQRVAYKSLNASTPLKVELIEIDKSSIKLSVFNTSNYNVEILGLNHNRKSITTLAESFFIPKNVKDTLTINLPRSFENLFVNKKKKVTGFILPKHIYQLNLNFKIGGVSKLHSTSIIPFQKNKVDENDLFRHPKYVHNHKSILVDDVNKIISFSKDSVVVSSPLVIKEGYTFSLKPGTIVNIIEGGKIISHSPVKLIGEELNPIKIYSSDFKGQGILVLSEGKRSKLSHVVFDRLRNPTHNNWGITGAVTFFESPVDLDNVAFRNNKSEDALNIVRTNFTMKKVEITNTQSDAFDGDFVKGTIDNCYFDRLGNDAIDVSGSDLIIRNVVVTNAGDKGLSAGENSKMTIVNVKISNSEIAVAGKDLSIVEAKKLNIENTKLGFTAFQKKPEFGPSNITVTGVTLTNIETNYLIESSSSMIVDGEKIETTQNVKDRMYGVEFGRSSAETRNSQ